MNIIRREKAVRRGYFVYGIFPVGGRLAHAGGIFGYGISSVGGRLAHAGGIFGYGISSVGEMLAHTGGIFFAYHVSPVVEMPSPCQGIIFGYHICAGGFPRPLPDFFVFFGDTIPTGHFCQQRQKYPKTPQSLRA